MIEQYLAQFSGNTARAYARDLADWTAFFTGELGTATRADATAWTAQLTGAPSTRNRKVSAVRGFYAFLLDEDDLIARNPFTSVKRVKNDDAAHTLGLTRADAIALLEVARNDSPRAHALVAGMLHWAVRIDSVLSLRVEDVFTEHGVAVARLTGKGGKTRLVPLAGAEDAVRSLIGNRKSGYVVAGRDGKLAQSTAFREIQRLAQLAGVAEADRITPHSLRATALTAALEAGIPIHIVQDFATHATAQQTQAYNRNRQRLTDSPAHTLTDWFQVA